MAEAEAEAKTKTEAVPWTRGNTRSISSEKIEGKERRKNRSNSRKREGRKSDKREISRDRQRIEHRGGRTNQGGTMLYGNLSKRF